MARTYLSLDATRQSIRDELAQSISRVHGWPGFPSVLLPYRTQSGAENKDGTDQDKPRQETEDHTDLSVLSRVTPAPRR